MPPLGDVGAYLHMRQLGDRRINQAKRDNAHTFRIFYVLADSLCTLGLIGTISQKRAEAKLYLTLFHWHRLLGFLPLLCQRIISKHFHNSSSLTVMYVARLGWP